MRRGEKRNPNSRSFDSSKALQRLSWDRILKALCVISVLMTALQITSFFENKTSSQILEKTVLHMANEDEMLEQLVGLAGLSDKEVVVPEGFEETVFSLQGYSEIDVQAQEGGGVLGFVAQGRCEEVLMVLHDELVENGWTSTGGITGVNETFAKESGMFNWVMSSGYSIGSSTSVVIHYSIHNEGR